MARSRLEIRTSRKTVFLGRLAGWLMKVYGWTLRLEIEDRSGVGDPERGGVRRIFGLWHDSIFPVPLAWQRLSGRHRRAVVLTSASHDGTVLAEAVGVFGLGAVRGSTSRRGVAAMVGLMRAIREGWDICITPDGPRGPRRHLQGGLVKLAEVTGLEMVPIRVEMADFWELGTWDRFRVPKPCSRVRVIFDEGLAVPRGLTDDAFEVWRQRLEGGMDGVRVFEKSKQDRSDESGDRWQGGGGAGTGRVSPGSAGIDGEGGDSRAGGGAGGG